MKQSVHFIAIHGGKTCIVSKSHKEERDIGGIVPLTKKERCHAQEFLAKHSSKIFMEEEETVFYG